MTFSPFSHLPLTYCDHDEQWRTEVTDHVLLAEALAEIACAAIDHETGEGYTPQARAAMKRAIGEHLGSLVPVEKQAEVGAKLDLWPSFATWHDDGCCDIGVRGHSGPCQVGS